MMSSELIETGAAVSSKEAAIERLVFLLKRAGSVTDAEKFRADVVTREAEVSTDIGGGIALPHAKSVFVVSPAIAALTLKAPIDSQSPDRIPVDLLFMIASPENDLFHLNTLISLARLLIADGLCGKLRSAPDGSAFLNIVREEENKNHFKGIQN